MEAIRLGEKQCTSCLGTGKICYIPKAWPMGTPPPPPDIKTCPKCGGSGITIDTSLPPAQ